VFISDKPPFQQHWNNTSKHITFTVLMNCLMFTECEMCMLICTFTNMNRNVCHQKKFMVKICLSYLQLLIMNISFISMICFSQCQICFSEFFGCC
jgi:hypothetical protein